MRPFLYRCPNTGQKVQTWAVMTPKTMTRATSIVPACAHAHLINPKNGKVLGSDDEVMRGVLALTHPARRSDGAVGPSGKL